MIVHMDLNLNEVLYCNKCKEELSNDAWLDVSAKKRNVNEVYCRVCSQSLPTSAKNGVN